MAWLTAVLGLWLARCKAKPVLPVFIGLGMDLICAYDRVRRLTAVELNYLYLYMAYPEKFWKIANRYYNTHKAWVSGRNIEKLEKFIRQEDERERFLEMMRHFTLQPPAS